MKPMSRTELKRSVEEHWQTVVRQTTAGSAAGPGSLADPTSVPYKAMRAAFFAGFGQCFHVVGDAAQALGEEEACKILWELEQELAQFIDEQNRLKGKGFSA